MAKKRSPIVPGDVAKFVVHDSVGYIQYLGKHNENGDAIRICRRTFKSEALVSEQLFSAGYIRFYPFCIAVARGFVEIVGRLPAPPVPHLLRRAGKRDGGKVRKWIIETGTSREIKESLSESERKLPTSGIMNHAFLVDRIYEGYDPENDERGF